RDGHRQHQRCDHREQRHDPTSTDFVPLLQDTPPVRGRPRADQSRYTVVYEPKATGPKSKVSSRSWTLDPSASWDLQPGAITASGGPFRTAAAPPSAGGRRPRPTAAR